MGSYFRNQKRRDFALQSAFVVTVFTAIIFGVVTTMRNLEAQGATVSWNFLDYATGWSVAFSFLPYDIASTYSYALVVGFVNSIVAGSISVVLAIILGVAVGAARLSANKIVNLLATIYVQLIRNTPLILQAFFWYALVKQLPPPRTAYSLLDGAYLSNRGVFLPGLNVDSAFMAASALTVVAGLLAVTALIRSQRTKGTSFTTTLRWFLYCLPLVAGAVLLLAGKDANIPWFTVPTIHGLRFDGGIAVSPELATLIVAITVFGAGYIAEIVRSGLGAIPKGIPEAARSLGLSGFQIFLKIELPLAVRIVLPPMTSQSIWLMKATTIGIAIGFTDFFSMVATSINHTGQSISLIFILVAGFWLINLSISVGCGWLNRLIAIPGERGAK